MPLCGRSDDIPKSQQPSASKVKSTDHSTIRATKFYDVNDKDSSANAKDYSLIKGTAIKGSSRYTRPQNYALEVNKINTSNTGDVKQLDFSLDEQPGVSNTFDVPTFDYQTMLNHNIYSNKNTKVQLPNIDDFPSKRQSVKN